MKIDLPKPKKAKSKEIGEYFDFVCPKCKAKKVKIYVYGYIDDPDRLSPREVAGGCCIEEDSPKWLCGACKHEWGRTADY